MLAVGYIRVSTDDQVGGYSMDVQLRDFKSHCHLKGWEVGEVYVEEGRSAWTESLAKRPALRRLLQDAEAGKFDVWVVHSLDRAFRHLLSMLQTFKLLAEWDVAFACVKQDIDLSTPIGRLLMTMMGAFAQFFSDNLSEHTKKGMWGRAISGLYNGEPPWPYERCTEQCWGQDGHHHPGCHIDPDMAVIVVELFERYAAGTDSDSTLAAWLNGQGFRTKSKRRWDTSNDAVATTARRFTNYSVRDLLTNAFFAGWVSHKEERFPGQHQAVISQDLFEKVQARRKANNSNKGVGASRKGESRHLLRGLLRCRYCAVRLWAQGQGSSSGTYYKFPKTGIEEPCGHEGKSFKGRGCDQEVNELFCNVELREEWKSYILEHHVDQSGAQAALALRREHERRLERAKGLYILGDLSWAEYTKVKAKEGAAIGDIYVPEMDDAAEAVKLLADFKTLWNSASPGRRNGLLHAMIDAVYIDPDTKRIISVVPKDALLGEAIGAITVPPVSPAR